MDIASLSSYLSIAKDAIVAVAASVGAGVAVRGLTTWNRQLTGSAQYELARRLLKSTYGMREAIRRLRNPIYRLDEIPSVQAAAEIPAEGSSNTHFDNRQLQAYQLRLEKVVEARNDVQTNLLEAEALWGSEVRGRFTPLFELQDEILGVANMSIRANDQTAPESSRVIYLESLKYVPDQYNWKGDERDEIARALSKSVEGIEHFLKPRLRK
jgi:hypothetical protein